MRIGIICQNFPPAVFEGGISHYSRILAEHLILLGHDVYAITSTEFSKAAEYDEEQQGLEVIRIRGPWKFSAVGEIRKAVVSNNIECIILQYSPASFDVCFRLIWACSSFPCQKITAFHTLWGRGLDRIVGTLTLFGSAKIIATNSEVMRILENRLPVLLKRAFWIPIGTNIPPTNKNGFADKRISTPVVSYFGMLYPGKGLQVVLDAIEQLKNRGNAFKFKFIGGGMIDHEDFEKRIQSEIEKRDLTDIVDWVGLVPERIVSQELSQSRFVFLPYDSGLSDRRGSFMAAIAHGRPVLTSPPVVEMLFLKNGENVVWPSESSPQHFVLIMEKLLTDDNLISRLSRGAHRLGKKFKWDKIARDYERVIYSPR